LPLTPHPPLGKTRKLAKSARLRCVVVAVSLQLFYLACQGAVPPSPIKNSPNTRQPDSQKVRHQDCQKPETGHHLYNSKESKLAPRARAKKVSQGKDFFLISLLLLALPAAHATPARQPIFCESSARNPPFFSCC
jgi:hypothetical protein